MNWNKILKALYGFFWLEVWKDSWLTELLVSAYEKLLGVNIQEQLESIAKQTRCASLFESDTLRYVKVLVDSEASSGTINL